MKKKTRTFLRDLKLAFREIRTLPLVLKGNLDDNGLVGMGEMDMLEKRNVPSLLTSLGSYLLPMYSDTRQKRPWTIRAEGHLPIVEDESWFFVNGIMTTEDIVRKNARYLSYILDRQINIVYNPTHGMRRDLGECILGRTFDISSDVAHFAAKQIQLELEAGKQVKIIGHSQGGIIASSVVRILMDFSTPAHLLSNLEVYTFAGAQDEFRAGPHYSEHFVNELDFVGRFGVIGMARHISGEIFIREGATGHLLNEHYLGAMVNGAYCNKESRLFKHINKVIGEK